jgi:hypothetical protein
MKSRPANNAAADEAWLGSASPLICMLGGLEYAASGSNELE